MEVVVIGGVAGGVAFATRLRRVDERAHITVIEKNSSTSFANCALPYYIGGVVNRNDLIVAPPEFLKKRYNLDIKTECEAVSINRDSRTVQVRNSEGEFAIPYDRLVISTGSIPVEPAYAKGVDGVFTLRTLSDIDAIEKYISSRQVSRALIIGGSFIGLEAAENLKKRGIDTTLVEAGSQVMPALDPEMASYLHETLIENGVRLKLDSKLFSISRNDDGTICAVLNNYEKLTMDLVIVAIGVTPNSQLARDCGLELTPDGHIITDDNMMTSDSSIFALGDVASVNFRLTGQRKSLPLAGPISKQVRAAVGYIIGQEKPFPGVLATWALHIFGMEAAGCGLTDTDIKKQELNDLCSVWLHNLNHASFIPGAEIVHLKLTFDMVTGRLMGAQAVGKAGAVKAVEIISTLIGTSSCVYDLVEREQAYAPPVSSARDVTGMAGSVAENVIDGLEKIARYDELTQEKFKNAFILDVRTQAEFSESHYEGAVNIELDSLRERITEIPKDRPVIVICRVGMRAYLACRILMGNGYKNVYDLSGGMLTLKAAGLV